MSRKELRSISPGNVSLSLYSVYLRGNHFVLYTDHKPLVKLGSVHNKTLNHMQEAC